MDAAASASMGGLIFAACQSATCSACPTQDQSSLVSVWSHPVCPRHKPGTTGVAYGKRHGAAAASNIRANPSMSCSSE